MDAYFPVEEVRNEEVPNEEAPNEEAPNEEVPNEGKGEQEVEEEQEGEVGQEGEGEEVNEEARRRGLRRMLITYDPEENVADKSLVPRIKELARLSVQVEDHIIIKSSLAQALDARYGEFVRAKDRVQDVSDVVKFGEISKES